MMDLKIFNYSDYRIFISEALKASKRGRLSRLASHLGFHPSRLSRVLNGRDHLSAEQAFLVAEFLKLDEFETEYLSELVNLARAVRPTFKKHIRSRLKKIEEVATGASPLSPPSRRMTAAEEKVYYSHYHYGAVWLSSMIPGQNTLNQISENLEVPLKTVEKISQFLVNTELCKLHNGRLIPGARLLEVKPESPELLQFLSNWRMFALEKISDRSSSDFFYSQPMAISQESYDKIKALLKETKKESLEIMSKKEAEKVACLNIDLFEISRKG